MVGVPGAAGPPPKRSELRRRTNTPAAGEPRRVAKGDDVQIPEPDPSWHPVARRWFESLKLSGQRVFYEPSDWATAFVIAESMSQEFKPRQVLNKDGELVEIDTPPSGATLSAWLRGMQSLCVTEGDRRRAAIELVAPVVEEGGDVSWLDDARLRLRQPG